MEIGRATAPVSQNFDFNSGVWKRAKWHELNGIQLGAIQEKSRFKALYDAEAVYFGIETELPENIRFTPCGQDGPCWGQDCLELILDPFGSREKYYHFIFNPVPGSRYDAAAGFITDVRILPMTSRIRLERAMGIFHSTFRRPAGPHW